MSADTLGERQLADLDEEQRYERFDRLQQLMPRVWERMRLNEENESVVVVPSVTLDQVTEGSGSLGQAMEERFLFLLLLLREPRLRMIYVTSMPVAPVIVEYYLALLPGIIPSHARSRLSLVAVNDSSPRPLAEKLLERPRLLRRSASWCPTERARTWCPTTRRRSSATWRSPWASRCTAPTLACSSSGPRPAVGGCSPRRTSGTPSGSRTCTRSTTSLDAIDAAARAAPDRAAAIVKLNEGVSGEGNALVDLAGLPSRRSARTSATRCERLRAMSFERPDMPFDALPGQARRTRGHRRGADHRRRDSQPQRAAAGAPGPARSSCCPRTTSCSAARAARAISAAASRLTSPTRGRSATRR